MSHKAKSFVDNCSENTDENTSEDYHIHYYSNHLQYEYFTRWPTTSQP